MLSAISSPSICERWNHQEALDWKTWEWHQINLRFHKHFPSPITEHQLTSQHSISLINSFHCDDSWERGRENKTSHPVPQSAFRFLCQNHREQENTVFAAYLMRAKYVAFFFFSFNLFFSCWGQNKGYYFLTWISSTVHDMFTKATISLCSLSAVIWFLPFFHPLGWYSCWMINILSPSVWVQSYQVLLMCFQFSSILLALPAEKLHQYYSERCFSLQCCL